jgi:cardiolipin synthase
MKHLPNALTIFRILLAPVFIYVYFSNYPNHHLWALFIFLFAGLTDVLDGYIARKFNAVSRIGIALDPLADKLILLAALGSFYFDGRILGIVFFFMLAVEATLMAVGTILHFKEGKSVIPSNRLGKTATLAFTLAIVLLFLFPDSAFTLATVIIAVIFKTAAFLSYMKKTLRILSD